MTVSVKTGGFLFPCEKTDAVKSFLTAFQRAAQYFIPPQNKPPPKRNAGSPGRPGTERGRGVCPGKNRFICDSTTKTAEKIFLSSGTVAAQGGKQFVFFWQGVRGFGFCDSIESAGKNFKKSRNTV